MMAQAEPKEDELAGLHEQLHEHEPEKARCRDAWGKQLKLCVKSDGWGQVVEAAEGYEKLAAAITQQSQELWSVEPLRGCDTELLRSVVAVLKARSQVLTGTGESEYPACEDMKLISGSLDALFTGENNNESEQLAFPIDMSRIPVHDTPATWLDEESFKLEKPTKPGGLLIPRPRGKEGDQFLSLELFEIGIKGAEDFCKPFVRVSVLDRKGRNLEPRQETPCAERQQRYCVKFNTVVHIQTPVRQIAEQDAAVFLEFVHYKEHANKNSTKCWCLLEPDEFSAERKVLEIYRKPIEMKRKRVKLFSSKKLYLSVGVMLSNGDETRET